MEYPERVTTKEESTQNRVLIAEGKLPDPIMKKWLRYAKVEGEDVKVYAQPMVIRKLSDEERAKREATKNAERELKAKLKAEKKAKKEAEKKKKTEAYLKRLAEAQKRREQNLIEQKKRYEEKLAKLNSKLGN